MSSASKSLGTALCWTALWVCLDQASKQLALEFLDEYSHKEIIQGFLSFSLTFNPGGAFGIFSTYPETFRNVLFCSARSSRSAPSWAGHSLPSARITLRFWASARF